MEIADQSSCRPTHEDYMCDTAYLSQYYTYSYINTRSRSEQAQKIKCLELS